MTYFHFLQTQEAGWPIKHDLAPVIRHQYWTTGAVVGGTVHAHKDVPTPTTTPLAHGVRHVDGVGRVRHYRQRVTRVG